MDYMKKIFAIFLKISYLKFVPSPGYEDSEECTPLKFLISNTFSVSGDRRPGGPGEGGV